MKSLIIIFLSIYTTLYATQAIQRELTFTQPDGTTFKGYMRGDSALHWIESNGEIIVYNPKDKYYYKAKIDEEKGLVPSSEKVEPQAAALNAQSVNTSISKSDKEALKKLYKKLREQNAPR